MTEVTPERIVALAAAARVPLPGGAPARIARAVTPTVRAMRRRTSPAARDRACKLRRRAARREPPGERHPRRCNLKELAPQIRVASCPRSRRRRRCCRASTNGSRCSTRSCGIEAEKRCRPRRPPTALAAGKAKGPLHGVPLAHKDMYYIAGKPAGCGSKIREGWIAPATSTAMQRLEAAGAFRIGALQHGRVRLWPDRAQRHISVTLAIRGTSTRITGGSSSGSAAAVGRAAGTCGARLRHRRLDPHAGAFLRHDRASSRPTAASAAPMPCRSRSRSTPSARWRRAPRIAPSSCGMIAGPDPLDPATAGAPAWDATATKRAAEGLTIGVPKSFYVDDLEPDVARHSTTRSRRSRARRQDGAGRSAGSDRGCGRRPDRSRGRGREPVTRRGCARGRRITARRCATGLRTDWLTAPSNIWKPCAGAAPCARRAPRRDRRMRRGAGAGVARGGAEDRGNRCRRRPNAEAIIDGMMRFMRPINYLGVPALVVPAGFGRPACRSACN